MLPEGIDQNSPYYTLLFDVTWETEPVDLSQWWSAWVLQRYGREDERAQRAWSILAGTVYGTKQEQKSMYGEKARDGVTSYMYSGDEEAIQPAWFNNSRVAEAWSLLTAFANDAAIFGGDNTGGGGGCAKAAVPDTLRYDIVNVGREVLAKISNGRFNALAQAKTPAAVAKAGAALKDLSVDMDELLCSGMRHVLSPCTFHTRSSLSVQILDSQLDGGLSQRVR
jgi:hypothetical protein